MKKLFTILSLCLATVALNAQNATITLEAHDVWGDGTGYQILLDADAAEYANLPSQWPCGTSYASYEYMIPTNASPDDANVIIDNVQTITIPAGTYDYVILNPGCEDYSTIYIASAQCDSSKYDNYEFEANKTYHFSLTLGANQQNDCVTLTITDNVGISENATSQVAVFPNPATNVLNVPADGYKTIEIVNLLGQVVYSNNVTEATMQISVRDLNKGIYFVRLANENGVATQKFIKK